MCVGPDVSYFEDKMNLTSFRLIEKFLVSFHWTKYMLILWNPSWLEVVISYDGLKKFVIDNLFFIQVNIISFR